MIIIVAEQVRPRHRSTMALAAACLAALACIASAAKPVVQPLFVPSARFPCFRQPAIISLPAKTSSAASPDVILAFAENRNVSACAPADAELLAKASAFHPEEVPPPSSPPLTSPMRCCAIREHPGNGVVVPFQVGSLNLRRSTDGGSTWLPMQTLYVGNIDFYSAVYDATSGKAHLMLRYAGASAPCAAPSPSPAPKTLHVAQAELIG